MSKFPLSIVLLIAAVLNFAQVESSLSQSFGDAFSGVGNNDEPVNIEADRLEIFDKKSQALFTGNVRVVQGTTIVTGKSIKVHYQKKNNPALSQSGVDKIIIDGGVTISSDDNRVSSDKATIDMKDNTATLTGNIVLVQGENVVKGCSLWIDLATKNTKLNHACSERITIIAVQPDGEDQ